ncbi:no exine formation 1 [Striga asiatica]|uniref:No exine formation 1 n=1 Tax=Striga asiatica TaxID=4170 RepID=A0A5A7QJ16_STRAF|nr:no exine formation 1 [Striga asiatica]
MHRNQPRFTVAPPPCLTVSLAAELCRLASPPRRCESSLEMDATMQVPAEMARRLCRPHHQRLPSTDSGIQPRTPSPAIYVVVVPADRRKATPPLMVASHSDGRRFSRRQAAANGRAVMAARSSDHRSRSHGDQKQHRREQQGAERFKSMADEGGRGLWMMVSWSPCSCVTDSGLWRLLFRGLQLQRDC